MPQVITPCGASSTSGDTGAWGSVYRSWGNVTPVIIPPYPGAYLIETDWTGGSLRYSDPQRVSWDSGDPTALTLDHFQSDVVVVHASVEINIAQVGGLAAFNPNGLMIFLAIQGAMDIAGTTLGMTTGVQYVWGGGAPTAVAALRVNATWQDTVGVYPGGGRRVAIKLANYDSSNADAHMVSAEMRVSLLPTVFDSVNQSPLA